MYYISLTTATNYKVKTSNSVSKFMHSNWITQSYYSHPKHKSLIPKYWSMGWQFSQKVLVQASLKENYFERIHSGHKGIHTCLKKARKYVFWVGYVTEIIISI